MRSARRSLTVAALLTLAVPHALYGQQGPDRVLIVYAHDSKSRGAVAFTEQLREAVLAGRGQVEFYEENLDFDRFPDVRRWPDQAEFIAGKYRSVSFDAIVAEGSMALRFSAEQLRPRFAGVPIVYGLVFEPTVDFSALPPDITGERLVPPFGATLHLARLLQPDIERVVLVGGAHPLDSTLINQGVRELTPLLGTLQLSVLNEWTYGSLLQSLRELPPRSIVILSSIRQDIRGQSLNTGDMIATVAQVSSVPVYGAARHWVGDGIVGGEVMKFDNNGAEIGRILLEILSNPDAPLRPAEVAKSSPVVDWRQLQRWGLSERALPPGTEVLFRAPSTWQRYRTTILAIFAVLAAQSVLIVLLLLERARRIRAQARLAEQAAYEQMVGELTVGTTLISPTEILNAFSTALASISRYANADAATLHITGNGHALPQSRFCWRKENAAQTVPGSANGLVDVELPLLADGAQVGLLVLRRESSTEWTRNCVDRLRSAAELLAGAVARARATSALEEIRSQVTHMARVATMGELSAAVSHELKQPLSAIRTNAEAGTMVLSQPAPDVKVAQAILEEILEDNHRASQVIEHLHMLFRKEKPAASLADINLVCRQAANLAEGEATFRGVELELSLAPDLPSIPGDIVQLQQVVLNLILNALDATATSERRHVSVATTLRDQAVEISVCDTGVGLSAEVHQHLFESFFSKKKHGLGMGLSIVRSIVERHHGEVRGANNGSAGATFTVLLPRALA